VTSKKLYYPACPNHDCKYKGLLTDDNINFTCQRCKKETTAPLYRYSFCVKLADMTGLVFAQVIGDESLGKVFTQMELKKIVQISSENDEGKIIREHLKNKFFSHFEVKLRVQTDTYKSKDHVKLTILSGVPI
jgi:hypothetical protein